MSEVTIENSVIEFVEVISTSPPETIEIVSSINNTTIVSETVEVIEIATQGERGIQGIQGERGVQGEQGIRGDIGTVSTLEISFNIPTDYWEAKHNLERFPSITTVDSANNLVYGDIGYTDMNTCFASFSYPFSGKMYLN